MEVAQRTTQLIHETAFLFSISPTKMGNQIPSPPPKHRDNHDDQYEDHHDDVGRIQERLARKYNKMVRQTYKHSLLFPGYDLLTTTHP